jgi:tRNA pseudouridine13 synthase
VSERNLTLAANPPRAHGAPLAVALLKAEAADFVVEETLPFAPDGAGDHRLLYVEKAGLDTLALARRLARLAGVAPREVGFAGLKDRHALTRQWFTLPKGGADEALAWCEPGRFRVLELHAHRRKLRRGALSGNRFRIRLRELAPLPTGESLALRIALISARGVPNYFGAQRFGRGLANLAAVEAFAAEGRLPPGREARAFVYSAARSLLFNAVLAERVRDGSWERLLPGERVNLQGSASHFSAPEIDATLLARLAANDVNPSGPLAGRSRGADSEGEALALEARVLAGDRPLLEALARDGLEAARRPLRLLPTALAGRLADGGAELSFELAPGAYATVVLRELFELREGGAELAAEVE